jgi:hypothetical protein
VEGQGRRLPAGVSYKKTGFPGLERFISPDISFLVQFMIYKEPFLWLGCDAGAPLVAISPAGDHEFRDLLDGALHCNQKCFSVGTPHPVVEGERESLAVPCRWPGSGNVFKFGLYRPTYRAFFRGLIFAHIAAHLADIIIGFAL